jgi:hypothetical protein
MVVSGEAWQLFKETHPERDFSDFWFEALLNFSINSFDHSSFFFFFVKTSLLLQWLQVLRASLRRSPLAQRLVNTIFLMLAILLKVAAATQAT